MRLFLKTNLLYLTIFFSSQVKVLWIHLMNYQGNTLKQILRIKLHLFENYFYGLKYGLKWNHKKIRHPFYMANSVLTV